MGQRMLIWIESSVDRWVDVRWVEERRVDTWVD